MAKSETAKATSRANAAYARACKAAKHATTEDIAHEQAIKLDASREDVMRARAAKVRMAEIDARNAQNKAKRQENLVKAREVNAANTAARHGQPAPPQMIERPADSPGLELRRASEIPDKPKADIASGVSSNASSTEQGVTPKSRDPRRTLQEAQERLQRRSLTMVRRLEEMTELALNDGPKCPTCQRGLPRAEDIRLRATIAVLDRAGLAPQRGQEGLGGATGPVLVFPPGTRIAIEAGDPRPEPIDLGTARRVERDIVMRRADEPVPE